MRPKYNVFGDPNTTDPNTLYLGNAETPLSATNRSRGDCAQPLCATVLTVSEQHLAPQDLGVSSPIISRFVLASCCLFACLYSISDSPSLHASAGLSAGLPHLLVSRLSSPVSRLSSLVPAPLSRSSRKYAIPPPPRLPPNPPEARADFSSRIRHKFRCKLVGGTHATTALHASQGDCHKLFAVELMKSKHCTPTALNSVFLCNSK